jgi:hypothetical protein
LKTLKTWKIDRQLLGFTKNFTNDRTLWVAIGNTMSSFKEIENGVPQGVVLSVTLFLVAMAKICDKLVCYIRADGHPKWLKTNSRDRRIKLLNWRTKPGHYIG